MFAIYGVIMKYYIKDHGQTAEDAYKFNSPFDCPEWDATRAAEDFYNRHDGCECGWPITFTIVDDAGKEEDVTVDCEYSPTFHAIGVKQ